MHSKDPVRSRQPGGPQWMLRPMIALAILSFFALLPAVSVCAEPQSEDEAFDGLFFGLDVGSQNYFSGAVIGGVDVLTRETKGVVDLSLGFRKQFGGRWIVGLRINYGLTDGDLEQTDAAGRFEISARNDSQFGYGGEIGLVLGQRRPIAVFLYGYETERDFDVVIRTPTGSFDQSDKQGIFRSGLGVELRLRPGLHLRGTVGSGWADFGDRFVSQDVDGKLDLGVGLTYQL